MTDPINKLRHDLANPLSALLSEAQLALMNDQLDPESRRSLEDIERMAIRMRAILRER
jgi:signal transduction histidine kinase